MDKFWMVWGPTFGSPEVRHLTLNAAKVEAARLAVKHPGYGFIILESLGHYKKEEIIWTQYV